ncbi:MAG TPA: exlusion protein FxsA, partial [Gammaproteobacteria bacterium]|nr:exlusion protein FxsA [Gammaproteobacteria bacterium]
LEMYLLISVGQMIGAGNTVLMVIITALIGMWLLRLQGLHTFSKAHVATQAGNLPAVELVEGVLLLLSGITLLTPGFLTDVIGFIVLVPSIRRPAAKFLLCHFLNRPGMRANARAYQSPPHTIEGNYRRED